MLIAKKNSSAKKDTVPFSLEKMVVGSGGGGGRGV